LPPDVILRLKCTKFDPQPPHCGSSQRSPRAQSPRLDLKGPTSKGRGREKEEGRGNGKGRGGEGREWKVASWLWGMDAPGYIARHLAIQHLSANVFDKLTIVPASL